MNAQVIEVVLLASSICASVQRQRLGVRFSSHIPHADAVAPVRLLGQS
jgi:hypothetical protein